MPVVTGDSVGLNLKTILQPSIRPLAIALIVSPTLYVATLFSENGIINWTGVIAGVCSYGVVYGIASWQFMLSRQERKGAQRLVRKMILQQS